MQFSIEKFITPFIENQFPRFYSEDGPTFIEFVKAYYEWMESIGKPIYEARNLYEYRDIDNTIEEFIEHFQKKYLYGIPFNVIINKRYLLKHILDVYRSKGSIQCYKLLFRLIYNEDVDVYLPGRDVLRVSDGTWFEPKYLEVTNVDSLKDYVSKKIIGLSSGTTAIVESYIIEPINKNINASLYISNILPKGGTFIKGEKIVIEGETTSDDINKAPVIVGSLDTINITSGGQNFNVGDILKVVQRDLSNNAPISYGTGGRLRVASVSKSIGSINFDINDGGFGTTANALIFVYNNEADTTGIGADFNLGVLSYTQSVQYNTDVIANRYTQTLDNTAFNFPANTSANISSTIQSSLTFQNNTFGTVYSLTNIQTGNSYTQPPYIFVRSTLLSNSLTGNVSYDTTSANITGSGTKFDIFFTNNSIIALQANSSNNDLEYHVIKTVNSNTSLTLYDKPLANSTASAKHKVAPTILPASFAPYETIMFREDETINGENVDILGLPSSGNNVVASLKAIDSGKGYVDNEYVKMYLHSGIETPTIVNAGNNYTNGDVLIFSGGGAVSMANGFVETNGNGNITTIIMDYHGSGYISEPHIAVSSRTGNGAYITTSLVEYNTSSVVEGRVVKSGVGRQLGYWTTTQGFLNSDKYIQDSYFYQDFSYQLKTATMLNKYKDILYNTFHVAGTELFGEYQKNITEISNNTIVYESIEKNMFANTPINPSVLSGLKVTSGTFTGGWRHRDNVSSINSYFSHAAMALCPSQFTSTEIKNSVAMTLDYLTVVPRQTNTAYPAGTLIQYPDGKVAWTNIAGTTSSNASQSTATMSVKGDFNYDGTAVFEYTGHQVPTSWQYWLLSVLVDGSGTYLSYELPDSHDAYVGTMLAALYQGNPNTTWLSANTKLPGLTRIDAIRLLTDHNISNNMSNNGLTYTFQNQLMANSTPYNIQYLADNCESYGGLVSLKEIETSLGNTSGANSISTTIDTLKTGINNLYSNTRFKSYYGDTDSATANGDAGFVQYLRFHMWPTLWSMSAEIARTNDVLTYTVNACPDIFVNNLDTFALSEWYWTVWKTTGNTVAANTLWNRVNSRSSANTTIVDKVLGLDLQNATISV